MKNHPFGLSALSRRAAAVLRFAAALTALCVLLPCAAASSPYRTLRKGDSGADVVALKTAMYYLGYFTSLNVSDQYNSVMVERVRQLQKANGLREDGVATPELQELVFSGRCRPAPGAPAPTPTPEAAPTPAPTAAPASSSGTAEGPDGTAPAESPVPSPSPAPVPGGASAESPVPSPSPSPAAPATVSPYRTLRKGDSGADVQRLKTAMYYLGYFTSLDVSGAYNDVMVKRIKALQKTNGLKEDGVATPELQEMIFSGLCRPTAGAPAPTPVPTPSPVPLSPSNLPAGVPETNEKGWLTEKGTYLYENSEAGLWLYKTENISITIARYGENGVVWFETEVWCGPESPMSSYLSPGSTPGKRYMSPLTMAQDSGAVLCLTDDFFGFRLNYNYRTGVVIREGRIIGERTYAADRSAFPNLEVLALFGDGSMKCYLSDAHTAREYLEMGAVSTFAFGPILVTDGKLGPHMTSATYYHYREPRCAIGMIEPYHYVIVTVKGRSDDSKGAYLNWLAERMLYLGCREAINLDGGGTVSLIFNGKMLNKTTKNLRSVTSLIIFGSR